ncbi:MAG: fumarate hydratase [Dehalococcoidia bacterium]|nr:MAG: fumarate hydratase [Dehalococcoidia bacterium]
MREIKAEEITRTVAALCKDANFFLGEDVLKALNKARDEEESPVARQVLDQIIRNAAVAAEEEMPLCQDCGLAIVFIEQGQDVHITGGDLYEAVDEGVRQGYADGYLRKSAVKQPFSARVNTKDNTPAIIHTWIVPGDRLKITVAPKGGGSENMSRFTVLKPAQGRQGVVDFVVNAVEEAGSNPCPPTIVGVGIGGSAEKAMIMAKKALLRHVGEPSPNPEVAELEGELLKRINATGVGAGGVGGRITSLAVHVETFPAHIASLPVAVNLQCHSARHKEAVL